MKENRYKRIDIKKKIRYVTFKNLIASMFILSIVVGISFITSKIVLSNQIEKFINERDKVNNEDETYKVISDVSNSIVTISDDDKKLVNNVFNEGNLSGVILNEDGYILTSYSNIKDKDKLYVKLSGVASEPIEAKFIGSEKETDIAVIKISCNNLVPIKLANYNEINVGQKVFAIGNAVSATPVGMIMPGIITSLNETITDGNDNSYRLIETNAIINKKNVGGMLANNKGELVGLITSNCIQQGSNNVSCTLGIKAVENISEYLVNLIDILGIDGGSSIDDSNSGIKGVYIQNIKKDGYAAKAGLLPTDIIIAIDGKKVENPEDLYFTVKSKKTGDNIGCDFLRDGTKKSVIIKFK